MKPNSAHAPGAEPLAILIGALGGEGGGVLTDWLVATAMARGYAVQSTSIPGVAQRTGATTYYLEIYPVPRSDLDGRQPILGLYPSPGRVDLAVMSELVEAGRAMENGFVTPDRTLLIASEHRVYAIAEKSAMGDGRFDGERILRAAEELARRTVLFDMGAAARESGSVISSVILGAIASSAALPFEREDFEAAIRDKGIAVEANLRGFRAGLGLAGLRLAGLGLARQSGSGKTDREPAADTPVSHAEGLPPQLRQRIETDFPDDLRGMVAEGARRLVDYQGARYAGLYLDRLARLPAAGSNKGNPGDSHALTLETARYLALWMSYEDAIRVADLKTRRERTEQVRADAGAQPDQPVRIVEYLDPGLDEIAAIMPPFVARMLLGMAERFPWLGRFRRPMRVRTDTVSGFLKLWLMARLRPFRPRTYRYAVEQAQIERWLDILAEAAARDHELGLEVARCAKLIKGYGETYERGWSNFLRILDTLVLPVLDGGGGGSSANRRIAQTVRRAREAALADPEGTALDQVLTGGDGGVSAPLQDHTAKGANTGTV